MVVTRSAEQAGDLSEQLRRAGFDVVEVPVIRIADPPDGGVGLRDALSRPAHWVVATSTNGARRVLAAGGVPIHARVAAVGPSTAAVFEQAGVHVDLVPDDAVGDALVRAFPPGTGRVVLAVAEVTPDTVERGLRAKGWSVERVTAYRTVAADVPPPLLERIRGSDAITFLSPSSVQSWIASVDRTLTPPVVVVVGPVTEAAARRHGLDDLHVAHPHTVDGVVTAVRAVLG